MTRVVIAGSGVAAVEAVLALRALAGRNFEIDLLAPHHALVDRPASVAAPFGLGAPQPLDLHGLAARYAVRLVEGALADVDVAARVVRLEDGGALPYDHLLVAVGAYPAPAVRGALTFRGPADAPAVERMLADAERGASRRIAVAVPVGVSWPLPAYELAIMARTELDMQGGRHVAVTVVTPEPEPLAIFGDEAGSALTDLLAQRRIGLRTGARPEHVTGDVLWLDSGELVLADTVLSLPRLEGPRVAGLPCDERGFIPTDPDGCVIGADRVFAAGDATSYPVKQGGLASQQADAAAATIARRLGAHATPRPFTTPVLRGVLLTGGAPLYLRTELDRSGQPVRTRQRRLRGGVSSRALWWPPGKVAGRYLAPYLATARPPIPADEPLVDL
jgi:sulfide:quinone oxidoreductase